MQNISDIQGIGDALTARFNSIGIRYVQELLALPTTGSTLANLCDALEGITLSSMLNRFIPQARFMQVKGCDGQLAEGLANTGLRSYYDLVSADPEHLVEELILQQSAGIIPEAPSVETVIKLQLDASKYGHCGNLIVYLSKNDPGDPDLPNVEGQMVTSTHPEVGQLMRRFSDHSEQVFFQQVLAGSSTVLILAQGYKRRSFVAHIPPGGTGIYGVTMEPGNDDPLETWSEFNGDVVPYGSDGQVYVKEKAYSSWNNMPKVPPLVIGTVGKNKTQLNSAWLIRRDNELEIPFVRVPNASIPDGANWKSVLAVNDNGNLELTGIDGDRYRELFVNVRIIGDGT